MRIDSWLVQHGLFNSRQRAQMAIKAGLVNCNNRTVSKPSYMVQPEDHIEVAGNPLSYVSQGGLKLEKAIRFFQLDFSEKRVLDAGASTGGFTDCVLQHGAEKVYAVDVGSDQLVPSLRTHPQVVFFENFDIRQLSIKQLDDEQVDLIVCDVSFISLTHILPAFPALLKPGGFIVLLIKPQFELEQRTVLKGGIVKDAAIREKTVQRVLNCAKSLGFHLLGRTETDIEEGKKNLEYLVWMTH